MDIEELNPGQRLRRGLRGFGMWLAAAAVCVFIPIAHFVLVPLCLIGAFLMLIRRLGQHSMVIRAHGRCPDCGAEQDLDLLGPWQGARKDLVCRACQRPLRLVAEGSAS